MNELAPSSFAEWYCEGKQGTFLRSRKAPGGVLEMIEVARPAGDMSRPALPDIVLYQDLLGGSRVRGDLGGGHFDVTGTRGHFCVAAPDFATTAVMEQRHELRSLAFPMAHWKGVLDEATDGKFSSDTSFVYGRMFDSPTIRAAVRNLWSVCDTEGTPSRLLSRAAGCEILAELSRAGNAPFAPVRGGLAPGARRRVIELLHARLAEDVSLDELAVEAQLSPFHFARMFKQSMGVPPRVYLTQLRIERVCKLLKETDASITQIALEVGYSSNQVLARVFLKHRQMSPSDYRRIVRA